MGSDTFGDQFVGTLGNPAIYQTCLTAQEVQEHYIAGTTNYRYTAAPLVSPTPTPTFTPTLTPNLNLNSYDSVIFSDSPIRYYSLNTSTVAGNTCLDMMGRYPSLTITDTSNLIADSYGYYASSDAINTTPLLTLPAGNFIDSMVTLEFWFYFNADYSNIPQRTFICSDSSTIAGIVLDNSGLYVASTNAQPYHSISANTFNHVVVTRLGPANLIYINGNLAAVTQLSSFGFHSCLYATSSFTGVLFNIGNIAVYDKPLSASQVANHYNRGIHGYRYQSLVTPTPTVTPTNSFTPTTSYTATVTPTVSHTTTVTPTVTPPVLPPIKFTSGVTPSSPTALTITGFPVGSLVDWGDGTQSTVVNTLNGAVAGPHDYTVVGQYSGFVAPVPGITYGFVSFSGPALFSVDDWSSFLGFQLQFLNTTNLSTVPTLLPPSIISTSGMFSGCGKFNSDVSKWDTSNIVDMSGMFDAGTFTSDLSTWNTNKVTNMSTMFAGCGAFTSDLSLWNTSNVTNMNSMFSGAATFNGSVSTWDTSKVTNMGGMFAGAKSFNQNISRWNVSNVTTMFGMFNGASVFNQNISSWDTSKVTRMDNMFYAAYTFNQDLSHWCVPLIASVPPNFSYQATRWALPKPVWGTCPV